MFKGYTDSIYNYITNFRNLTLEEYIYIRSYFCHTGHMQPCLQCLSMLSIANTVVSEGYCKLSESFRKAFPALSYKTDIARERVLQMSLACIRFGSPEKGGIWLNI